MGALEINGKNFPQNLKKISPKVSKLFYKGNYNEKLFQKSIAVVGSRRMSSYVQRVIEKIIPPLVNAGITIVSGFIY